MKDLQELKARIVRVIDIVANATYDDEEAAKADLPNILEAVHRLINYAAENTEDKEGSKALLKILISADIMLGWLLEVVDIATSSEIDKSN